MSRTPKMNIDRMIETIALLRRVHRRQKTAERKFDFDHWGHIECNGSCGMAACAAGEMTLHPPFVAVGFKPESNRHLYPRFKGFGGEGALAKFLGISEAEASWAFINLGELIHKSPKEVTALDVAKHLQKMLNNEQKRLAKRVPA